MKLEQTERGYINATNVTRQRIRWSVTRVVEKALISAILIWAMWIQAGSAIPASEARLRIFAQPTAGLGFNLVAWEVESLSAKLRAMLMPPSLHLTETEATQLVRDYMARAGHVGHLEREIERLEAQPTVVAEEAVKLGEMQGELAALRLVQQSARPIVEDILERQVSWAIGESGMGVGGRVLPPVKFGFTEPPRKVIVSPRDHIATIYTRMIQAGLPLSTLEQIEARIAEQPNTVGYVSNIGGLGAYPAMVVDRSHLPWVISTVAHEWAHNYLTFFPLGLFYFGSGDLTTMNETVADIVGEEIGLMVLRRYYPDLAPADPEPEMELETLLEDLEEPVLPAEVEEDVFDFRAEMQETRLEVERLLAEGRIEEAEAYMEARRLHFVENGYGIRVLNQAYFAFHGSYAMSPASVSPIGPKLQALREATPDLPAFLHTVRWFNSHADLDAALAEWVEPELP